MLAHVAAGLLVVGTVGAAVAAFTVALIYASGQAAGAEDEEG